MTEFDTRSSDRNDDVDKHSYDEAVELIGEHLLCIINLQSW